MKSGPGERGARAGRTDREPFERRIARKGVEHVFYENVYDELGDVFSLEEVATLLETEKDDVADLLERSSRHGFVRPDGENFKKRTRTLSSLLSSDDIPESELVRAKLETGLDDLVLAERRGLPLRTFKKKLKRALAMMPVTHVSDARRYLNRFKSYAFTEELFMAVFAEDARMYRFLSLKVRSDQRDVRGMYARLNEVQRARFRRHLSVFVNRVGNLEEATMTGVFEHVCWMNAGQAHMSIDGLKTLYDAFLDEQFDEWTAERLKADERKLASIASRSCRILSSDNRYRFYDASVLTKRNLQRLRGLLRLEPGFYSTEHIFGLDPSLMEDLDCITHEELHQIIRHHVTVKNVTMGRLPEIAIGVDDKSVWLKRLVRRHGPMEISDFLEILHASFGLSPRSVRRTLKDALPELVSPDGMIGVTMSGATKREIDWFSRRLTRDIYTLEELEGMFREVKDFKARFMNPVSLERCGFTLRGGLVLRSHHDSADSYFKKLLVASDFFIVPDEPAFKTATFKRAVKDLEDRHDIFRFDERQYIHLTRLRKAGVNKGVVRGFIKEVIEHVKRQQWEYFTVPMIHHQVESSLWELGLEDIFFEGLLHSHPKIGAIRTGSGDIFYLGKGPRSLGGLFIEHLPKDGGMEPLELREDIETSLHLLFDESAIVSAIRDRGGHFSPETGKLYQDKQTFLDSIYSIDE